MEDLPLASCRERRVRTLALYRATSSFPLFLPPASAYTVYLLPTQHPTPKKNTPGFHDSGFKMDQLQSESAPPLFGGGDFFIFIEKLCWPGY